MTRYATIADLRARFAESELVQLTAEPGGTVVVAARCEQALDQATNLIDGYLATVYARLDTVAPIPPMLVDLACDIARYRLYTRGSAPEQIATNYKDALARLRDLAKGVIKLDLGQEAFDARDGQILVTSSDRIFSRPAMEGW